MNPILTLLQIWKQKAPPEHDVRRVLPDIIRKHTKAEIAPENISLTRATAFIKTSSMVKAEIFIKKAKILEDLTRALGEKAPRDIR